MLADALQEADGLLQLHVPVACRVFSNACAHLVRLLLALVWRVGLTTLGIVFDGVRFLLGVLLVVLVPALLLLCRGRLVFRNVLWRRAGLLSGRDNSFLFGVHF